jgi:small subunit ribosomal protein S16
MLRIRLRRTGAKKKPTYRLVVAEARSPRDGAFLDILGHYNPRTDPSTVVIDAAKAQRWLSNGAQPTDRVARLFKREGIERGAVAAQPGPTAAVEAPAATEAPTRAPARRPRKAATEETGAEARAEATTVEAAPEGAAGEAPAETTAAEGAEDTAAPARRAPSRRRTAAQTDGEEPAPTEPPARAEGV